MYQPIPPRPPKETMPTMYDLPSELVRESGLPDEAAGWVLTLAERAEQERQRADRLAEYLRSQGVDPDSLS